MYLGNKDKLYVYELNEDTNNEEFRSSYSVWETEPNLCYLELDFSKNTAKELIRAKYSNLHSSLWDMLEEIYNCVIT